MDDGSGDESTQIPDLGVGNVDLVATYGLYKRSGAGRSAGFLVFARTFLNRQQRLLCINAAMYSLESANGATDFLYLARFVSQLLHEPAFALKILSRGVHRHMEDLLLWEALAETHRLAKSDRKIVEAEYQTFKRYDRLAPERVPARDAWSSFGQLLNDVASFDLAREAYNRAIDIDPNYAWALNRLSILLRRRFKLFQEAEALALRSISADPENGWSWYNLGYIYQVHLRRIPDAIEAYRRSVSLDSDYVRPWENLGALLAWEANDATGAEDAFLKARDLGDMSAYGLNHYGVFLREHTDRFQEAEKALQTAISLEPLEWRHRVALAVLYEKKLARYSDARQLLLEARSLGASLHDIEYRLALSSQKLRRMISPVPR